MGKLNWWGRMIFNFLNLQCQCIIEHNNNNNYDDDDATDVCFPSVGVPQDEQFVYISRALFIVYTILSCIGIGFAIVCLAMNLIFKERKYVEAWTPAWPLTVAPVMTTVERFYC